MRLITDVLRDIRKGQAVDIASRAMAEVVRGVIAHGKPGEVTITVKVKPDKEAGAFSLSPSVKYKIPMPDLAEGIFFADEAGNLVREDPRQKDIEDEIGQRRSQRQRVPA